MTKRKEKIKFKKIPKQEISKKILERMTDRIEQKASELMQEDLKESISINISIKNDLHVEELLNYIRDETKVAGYKTITGAELARLLTCFCIQRLEGHLEDYYDYAISEIIS